MKPGLGSPQKTSFTSLAEVLKKQLDSVTGDRFSSSLSLQKLWVQIVGPAIAAHSHVLYHKQDLLFIAVTNSTWNSELSFMKGQIIERINASQKQHIISDIVFKIRSTAD